MSDILKFLRQTSEPFKITPVPINQCYQIVIDGPCEDVSQFAEIVDHLNNANEGDVAHVRLTTPGGALASIIPLMEAFRHTEAHIAMHVESDTASAGTILMMLADEVYINPFSSIMIHTASYGYGGHAGNMEAHVTHNTAAIKRLVQETYAGFLTPEEIGRVQDGLEIYLTDEECYERFKRRNDLRSAKVAPQKKVRAKRVKPAAEAPQQQAA